MFKPSTWFGEGSWFTGNSVFPWTWEYNVTDVASGASAAGDATTALVEQGQVPEKQRLMLHISV